MIKINPTIFTTASSIRPCSIQIPTRTYEILWDPIAITLRAFRLVAHKHELGGFMISITTLTIKVYRFCGAAHLIPAPWSYMYEKSKPKCRHVIERSIAQVHWNINRMDGTTL